MAQAAFPDGIFWVEIGREARELVSRMAQIGARLGDDPKLYSTLETSQDNLRNLLRSKAALIVLDDVWDAKWLPSSRRMPRAAASSSRPAMARLPSNTMPRKSALAS